MTPLLQQIGKHRFQLEQHPLCQQLRYRDDVSTNAYAFVPHMTFFVLGFRDILETIRVENPSNDLERSLNTHCEEDSEHWLWFLEDLQRLGMDVNYWGGNMSSILKSLWSRENYPVRDLVYRLVDHVRSCQTAAEKMIIIDCLESAFSVFINSLNVITHRNGHYQKLKYFGAHHYEDEANHSTSNWLKGENTQHQDSTYEVPSFRSQHMSKVIDDIFAGFDRVFSRWHSTLAADTMEMGWVKEEILHPHPDDCTQFLGLEKPSAINSLSSDTRNKLEEFLQKHGEQAIVKLLDTVR